MVKKRNHYIPRVLLRRFAFRETHKRQAYLWQLGREGKALQLETKNAGVESFFYGDPNTGVEDGLADVEAEWQGLLAHLDQAASVDNLRSDLWRLAWVLGIRTRAIREHWSRTGRGLLTAMVATEDRTMVEAMLRLFDKTVGDNWEGALSEFPEEGREAVRRAVDADPTLKTRILDQVRGQVATKMPALFRFLLGAVASKTVSGGAAQGQIKGLAALLTNESAQLDRFAPEAWTVLSFAPQSVVLGDGVAFTVGPEGQLGSTGRFKGSLEAIYVPISHQRVLVGHRRGAALLDSLAINAASAGLSSDVIFAARNSDIERALTVQIGSIEPMLTDAERAEVLDDVWRDFGKS